MTTKEEIAKCDYNIQDAHEALECAIGMRDWEGVKKYADQLKEWEHKRYLLTSHLERMGT